MQQTNYIILSSKDRGTDYGVGTFIRHLSRGLVSIPGIMVCILEIGTSPNKSFTVRKQDNFLIFSIPLKENTKEFDSIKNQEKLARNTVRVVSKYLPPCDKTVIHINYVFQHFIAKELKTALSGILVFTQHITIFNDMFSESVFNTEIETCKLVDRVVTVTQHGKGHLAVKGVDKNKIEVIYNGIDPEDFNTEKQYSEVRQKYGLTRDEKLILYSGRIDPVKGLDYLCAAIKQLIEDMPSCRLVIAGNGSYESIIPKTGRFSANVSYLGFIPFEDLAALYHIADIGVIPSLEEQCSYVALEMLHSGLPVVASNVGGLKEIFIHNENALLVDVVLDKSNMYGIAPDVKQFKNYMLKLLGNKKLRDRFSTNAITRTNRYFTLKNMVNRYLQTVKIIN